VRGKVLVSVVMGSIQVKDDFELQFLMFFPLFMQACVIIFEKKIIIIKLNV